MEKNKLEKRLESISLSLKSNSREFGPHIYNKKINKIIFSNNEIKSDFSKKVLEIFYNISVPEYYEHSLKEYNSKLSSNGTLISYSGIKTGRSPNDKRIVYSELYDKYIWQDSNSPNIIMKESDYEINRETAICYLNNLEKIYVFDGYAGWDKTNRIKVRVISSRAYHCLFMHNMLIRPTDEDLENFNDPDFTIYNAGCFPCNRYTGNMTSSTSVDLNLEKGEIVILGTQYAGEMKKAIFSIMNFFMPLNNKLSLHSSCNVSNDNSNTCLFFGLSGTGKTTLSADSSRQLIGDDEHVWTDEGIFNIEGGCYAKCLNLDGEKEPEIFNAIKFGSLLENILTDDKRNVLFENSEITQNTRACYPINFISNVKMPCITGHPNNIILLTCDAFGVLPPVSKLNRVQAMYHFINGYTAKIAGTEQGVKKPLATFSACYGEAFIVWHPLKYAELLAEKMDKHNVNCWLVNTGWIGGKYGEGKRCPIKVTKQIVKMIHNGELANQEFEAFNTFNLLIPKNIEGVDSNILNPINSWNDKNAYKKQLNELANLFIENSKKYNLKNYKSNIFNNIVKIE